jgi:hypothetical protein
MNDNKKLKRLVELSNELKLQEGITREEFKNEFLEESVKDLEEEMWQLYCFASDVIYTLNLKDEEMEVEE